MKIHPRILLLLGLVVVAAPAAAGPAATSEAGIGGGASLPAPNHDPSCLVVYENITGTQSFAPLLPDGNALLDDVHTNTGGDFSLCAVDVRGRPTSAGTMSVYVYANSGDASVPGALLAGPVDFVFGAGSSINSDYHAEFTPVTVGPDLWIGVGWSGQGGLVATPRNTATVGTSHDTWYFISPGGNAFDDWGTNQADLNLVVYGAAPVPTAPSTWGALKAIYR